MAQVNGKPYTLEWGGVVIEGIEEIDTSGIKKDVNKKTLMDGSTQYFPQAAEGELVIKMSSQDVVALKVALVDYFVDVAGTLGDTTVVTAPNGLIEIGNSCSATVTTADAVLKSCDGLVRLSVKAARAIFTDFTIEDDGDLVGVTFGSTAATTVATIGNQA